MNFENITYGIIGLGLMGGTIAKSIRKNVLSENQCAKIIALDKNKESLENAFSEKIIDSYFFPEETKKMLEQCDVVFICLYPHATLDFLLKNKKNFKSGSIITDISGVKGIFEKKLPELLRNDVDFIIGHPMAGGEKEGYTSSNSSFFGTVILSFGCTDGFSPIAFGISSALIHVIIFLYHGCFFSRQFPQISHAPKLLQ